MRLDRNAGSDAAQAGRRNWAASMAWVGESECAAQARRARLDPPGPGPRGARRFRHAIARGLIGRERQATHWS